MKLPYGSFLIDNKNYQLYNLDRKYDNKSKVNLVKKVKQLKISKREVIIFLVIIELLLVFLLIQSYNNKNLDKYKFGIKEIMNNKLFAVMIEDDNGDYQQATSFPPTNYVFNSELSSCMDLERNVVENALSYTNGVATVTTTKSIQCYLFFNQPPPDLKVLVNTDGNKGVAPTRFYNSSIDCANASYNKKYLRLEFTNLNAPETCNLTFTPNTTSYPLLSSKITATTVAQGNEGAVNEGDVGYRYEGTNPDNYVWFNNELWRIIGLVPTKTSSGTENLVKIIRNESIGGLAYDAKSSGYTGAWGSNTLYTLLNSYYYGKLDGTDTAYCYGYQATAKAKCNYTSIGINASDYYGSMVKNVYWNTGASGYNVTASAAYTAEIATQTVTGYIGLMSASDYGYASSGSHTTSMYSYDNATHTLGNWLYGNGYEWTSIQYSSSTNDALSVDSSGNVVYYNARRGYAVRPVLYLDSSVYVVNGSGTESDPYILGM